MIPPGFYYCNNCGKLLSPLDTAHVCGPPVTLNLPTPLGPPSLLERVLPYVEAIAKVSKEAYEGYGPALESRWKPDQDLVEEIRRALAKKEEPTRTLF